jgi:hypothetical protein
MEVSIADVARERRVSERRVLYMVEAGELAARKVGGRWLVDQRELARRPRLGRPMSPRMAWAMIGALSGAAPQGLGQSEVSRLNARVRRLREEPDSVALLSSWLRSRADLHRMRAPEAAIRELLQDERFVHSGISDPRAGLSSGREAEGYVRPADLAALVREYLLLPSSDPNVFLRVADAGLRGAGPMGGVVTGVAPLGAVVADLADHNGPREDAQARRLLEAA